MSDQPLIRRCDVAIVGGSAAGLAAALQLVRQNRSVIVIDAGEPRNAPAAHMHGYLGHDGAPPPHLTSIGRDEVRSYAGEILDGRVGAVRRNGDEFEVDAGNVVVRAKRVIAATGVVDQLPPIEGLSTHWGDTVIHCPFCHGYEVRDRRLVQVVDRAIGLHPARLFVNLASELTLVVDPDLEVDPEELAALERAGAIHTTGSPARVVEDDFGALVAVELTDGRVLPAETVVVTTALQLRVEPFAELGLTTQAHPSGIADIVATGPTGETAVPGLFAAGNITDPSAQVLPAAAEGSRVGAMVAFDLAALSDAGETATANATEWNERYAGDAIWSGSPNGALVAEVDQLAPGRALDVAAGEGGDAIWLAERGWSVTATDVASSALDRLRLVAAERDLHVDTILTDANALQAFGPDTFDLVSLCYSAIPRSGDDRAITNLLDAVAPGGVLLVVGHAPASHHQSDSPESEPHTTPWDRHAFVGVDDVGRAVRSASGWTVEVDEVRDRPPGSVSHHHHDTDRVFRARRHSR